MTLWATLARRYAEEPAVLFDLFNEPHDLLSDDPHKLLGVYPGGVIAPIPGRRVGMKQWQPLGASPDRRQSARIIRSR